MNRRDFFRMRTTPQGRTCELSCRSFYLRFLDSERLATMGADPSWLGREPWVGEPPAAVVERAADFLARQLEEDLRHAQVLRLVDGDWPAPAHFSERIEPVLSRFRARGGLVEVVSSPGGSPTA